MRPALGNRGERAVGIRAVEKRCGTVQIFAHSSWVATRRGLIGMSLPL
jgi:hypothetical protein